MDLRKFCRRATAIFVLFGLILIPSCAPNPQDLTDYADRGFTVSVFFERGGADYAAKVVAGEPPEAEEGPHQENDLRGLQG